MGGFSKSTHHLLLLARKLIEGVELVERYSKENTCMHVQLTNYFNPKSQSRLCGQNCDVCLKEERLKVSPYLKFQKISMWDGGDPEQYKYLDWREQKRKRKLAREKKLKQPCDGPSFSVSPPLIHCL